MRTVVGGTLIEVALITWLALQFPVGTLMGRWLKGCG
jgi:hypothetical protein